MLKKLAFTRIILSGLLVFSTVATRGAEAEAHRVNYVNPRAYLVTYSVTLDNVDAAVNSLEIYMPFPKEYDSQTNVNVREIQPEGYQLNSDPQGKAKMLYWLKYGEPGKGEKLIFREKFEYVCYEINTDGDSMKSAVKGQWEAAVDVMNVAPYNTQSKIYNDYTIGERYIEADNPQIIQQAQEIVGIEEDPYKNARNIYDWVRGHMYWRQVYGLKGALFALQNGYGECGDYSALFCALCRASDIPARPVVGFWASSGKSCHVWAEFYLEDCGWIPVDPSVGDSGNPDYYFGNLDNRRIIFSKGYNINLVPTPHLFPVDPVVGLFQTYFWWWRGSGSLVSDLTLEVAPAFPAFLALTKGWNLISLSLEPVYTEPSVLLYFVSTKFNSVWTCEPDAGWSVYVPNGPSNLGKMERGKGYWIEMNQSETLVIHGTDPGPERIYLKGGKWSLVGHNSLSLLPIGSISPSIPDGTCIYTYDSEEERWLKYFKGGPSFLNDLDLLEPGRGYWFYVEQDWAIDY